MSRSGEVTQILNEMAEGEETSPERLLELVYDDLRRLAGAYMRNEPSDHTLQATALVHEAYMRLVDWKTVSWQSRAQFFAVAAQVMRKTLIDHARKRRSQKRGGHKVVLDEAVSLSGSRPIELIALDDALQTLETLDARQAKIVELRFFGGLSIEETAYVMKISETTVRREWSFAKAWFQLELSNSDA